MKKRTLLLLLFLYMSCLPLAAQEGGSFRFIHSYVTSHCHSLLVWQSVPSATQYTLYRQYPQGVFSSVATIADTQYADTLHRVICSDTVSYFVSASSGDTTLFSDTVGLHFQDNVPTSPCQLRLCSVDTALNQIRLSWYPSPDTDVMGYYICMGSPCLDYDTVWGRLNTTYLCPSSLDPTDSVHLFRILAFDSCFQSSPLTPAYHHPVLNISSLPCSRRVTISWNQYDYMPGGVRLYTLYYSLPGDDNIHSFSVESEGLFQFDTTIADLSVSGLKAWLCVTDSADSLQAFSSCRTFNFDYGDTARYLNIDAVEYNPSVPSIELSIDIDPLYSGPELYLLRSQGEMPFEVRETLAYTPPTIDYTDFDVSRTAGSYRYILAAPDDCRHRFTYSDTAQLLLPVVHDAMAIFPNTIISGSVSNGQFCPQYISPLSQDYSLSIFTRWGQCVFQSDQLDACWNGTSDAGHQLPQGVYVYRAHCRFADATERTYIGTVLLIK